MSKLNSNVKFGVGIKGMGYYVPDKVITNFDLMKDIETTDEWIREKIGIVERRRAKDTETLTDLAVEAGIRAINNANLKPEDIDLILLSRVVPDHINPPTSCRVQYRLGAVNSGAFDIDAGGCPGSIYSLSIGANFISSGSYKNILVICGDILSRSFLDYKDRNSCCFFGDGAAAVVLSRVPLGKGIQTFYLKTDGSKYDKIMVKAGGIETPLTVENINNRDLRYLRMDNKATWEFATSVFPESIRYVTEEAGYKLSDIDLLLSHQANINIIKTSMKVLGIDMSKTYTTIEKYGNTVGASLLITLCEAYEKGKISNDSKIALVSFGSGVGWGAMFMKWVGRDDFI
ncbi:MAG: fabH1 [Clostridia bacterium]|jgi:3-oxoacyl-[acyl-carrier-protein] synthase-3|uniref:3-oxoacyl-ACP synthase III family protein n=1 Tax=Petroclostridium xylanilyticum TaxID=1792311 RepID=UPI000B996B51|nr:ketoacyl-ACP synthase III [Petroclostridium xylanilyticum]MBZ4646022.1 fabH1 [Clostridia bacterium]